MQINQLNRIKRKKIAISSDSITKPMDMREFNDIVVIGDAIKLAYRGGGGGGGGGGYCSKAELLC